MVTQRTRVISGIFVCAFGARCSAVSFFACTLFCAGSSRSAGNGTAGFIGRTAASHGPIESRGLKTPALHDAPSPACALSSQERNKEIKTKIKRQKNSAYDSLIDRLKQSYIFWYCYSQIRFPTDDDDDDDPKSLSFKNPFIFFCGRFRSITKQYYRRADGVILVYDVSSETSFKNIRGWMCNLQASEPSHLSRHCEWDVAVLNCAWRMFVRRRALAGRWCSCCWETRST